MRTKQSPAKPAVAAKQGGNEMSKEMKSATAGLNRRQALVAGGAVVGATWLGAGLCRPALAADRTINVLTLGEGIFGEPFMKLSKDFTAATGVKVNNVTTGYNESMQKQAAMFAAQGSELDVVQVDNFFLKGYAKAGHLAKLNGALIPETFVKDFNADVPTAVRELWQVDGDNFGMATIGNCQSFYYNSAHLKDAGVEPPDTWEEFLVAARKVVDPSKKRYGFVTSTERLTKAVTDFLTIFWAEGGKLFNDKMQPTIDDAAGLYAINMIVELIKTMPPGGAAYTESDEVKALAVGLGSLDPMSWIPDSIKTADAVTKPQLATRVSPKGSVRRAPVLGGMGLCVSNYSPSKEAAAQFVQWFNTAEVQRDKIVQNGGQPCRTSAWAANLDKEPWFPALAENFKVAHALPQIPEWGQIDAAVSTQLAYAFAGQVDPKSAIKQAQADVDKIMKEAGYYQ
jgi:multiple sugar transport system substrate-binding protein